MERDPFEIAIDQILEGAEGDVRLALRTVLIQNMQLEAELSALSDDTQAARRYPHRHRQIN
jgi:hypothetical protein